MKGGLSHTYHCSLLGPTRKITISSLHNNKLQAPNNSNHSLLWPVRGCHHFTHLQPIRSHQHCELSFSSNEHCSKQLLQLLFLYKRMLSSFVLKICLWFTIVSFSWVAIPLLLPNKLDFAGWSFTFFLIKSWHFMVSEVGFKGNEPTETNEPLYHVWHSLVLLMLSAPVICLLPFSLVNLLWDLIL